MMREKKSNRLRVAVQLDENLATGLEHELSLRRAGTAEDRSMTMSDLVRDLLRLALLESSF